jgi:hypothetical protein
MHNLVLEKILQFHLKNSFVIMVNKKSKKKESKKWKSKKNKKKNKKNKRRKRVVSSSFSSLGTKIEDDFFKDMDLLNDLFEEKSRHV